MNLGISRTSLQFKLLLQFGILFLAIFSLLWLVFSRMPSISERAELIRNELQPSSEILADISKMTQSVRLLQAEYIHADSGQSQIQIEEKLTDFQFKIAEKLVQLEEMVANSQKSALYLAYFDLNKVNHQSTGNQMDEVNELHEYYEKLFESNRQLFAAQKDNDMAKMEKIYHTLSAEAFANIEKPLDELSFERSFIGNAIVVDNLKTAEQTQIIITSAVALVFLVAVFTLFYIQRNIIRPIRSTSLIMEQISLGDLDLKISGLNRKDEVGMLMRALDILRRRAQTARALEHERIEESAAKEMQAQRITNLAKEFDQVVKNVANNVTEGANEIESTASSMGHDVGRTSSRSAEAADACEKMMENVQILTRSAKGFVKKVAVVTDGVQESARIANEAVETARHTNEKVHGLSGAAQRIGEVVGLISQIAKQTNLLALNATIEASRAGESGRGFAVVAGEVKSLAAQTARATAEITAQIERVQEATQQTVDAIGEIAQTIIGVNGITHEIAQSVHEQSEEAANMLQVVDHVNEAAELITERFRDVVLASAYTHSSSLQVIWAANDLVKPTNTLLGELDNFVGGLQSA